MLKFLAAIQADSWKSLGRSAGIVVATGLATLALITPEMHDQLVQAFSDIWEGVRLIAKGLAVAIPIAIAVINMIKASPWSRLKLLAKSNPVDVLQAAAQTPGTVKIVNPSLAEQVPSEKVVKQ